MSADPIADLISQAGQDDGKLVSVVDSVIELLEEKNLAYRLSLPPRLVGIHPCNRDGYGVSEPEVHQLGAEIVAMGWSFHETRHAVCIEDDALGTIGTFSMKIKNRADSLADAHDETSANSDRCLVHIRISFCARC